MAQDEVEFKIKPELDVQPSIAELKKLQKELKTTTDPGRFKQLQQEIDDMKEAINAAKTGAGNFAEVVGTLPGPIGEVGNKVGGLIGTLKQFSQTKFTDIKGSFSELGKDLVDVGKGLSNLTGLTKVYTFTNNALSKSFFGVAAGETAAATAAGVLTAALAATGITLIIGAIGLLVKAYDNWANGAEKAAEAQKTLNEQLEKGAQAGTAAALKFSKSMEEIDVKRAQAAGKTEAEIQKIREQYAEDRIRITKEGLSKLQKIQGADTTAAADAVSDAEDEKTKIVLDAQIARNKKIEENNKANAAITKQELETLKKARIEARNAILEDEKKEKAVVEQKYAELIKLARKNGQDTKDFEKAKAKEVSEITDKYAKQRLEKEKEDAVALETFNRKAKDIKTAAIEDDVKQQLQAREDRYQNDLKDLEADKEFIKKSETEKQQLRESLRTGLEQDQTKIKTDARIKDLTDELDILNIQHNTLTENTSAYFDNLRAIEDKAYQIKKEKAKGNAAQIEAIEAEHARNSVNIDKQEKDAKLRLYNDYADRTIGIAQGLQKIAGANKGLAKAAIRIEQAATTGKIIMNDLSAIRTAYSASPLTFGLPWSAFYAADLAIGVIAANQSANNAIAALDAVQTPGGSSGGGGTSVSPPSYGGAPTGITAPQIQTTGGQNPATAISQTIQQANQNPVRAYVVSQDIQNQSALDRRTNKAATFGLG